MSTHDFKVGDIVRYERRHSLYGEAEHNGKIGIVVGIDENDDTVQIRWSPFLCKVDDNYDWAAVSMNLDILGHIDEGS